MKDVGDQDRLSPDEIEGLLRDVCGRAGFPAGVAASLARTIVAAECAGQRRLGLGLVPQLIEHARAGRVDPTTDPVAVDIAPGALRLDARGGFACPAIETALPGMQERARHLGLACLRIDNAYPVPSLAALHAAADGHDLTLAGRVMGLVPRPTPSARVALRIEPVDLGTGTDVARVSVSLLSEGTQPQQATPAFDGPVGAAFGLSHFIVFLRRGLWPDPPPRAAPALKAPETGIAVPASLLEKIINA